MTLLVYVLLATLGMEHLVMVYGSNNVVLLYQSLQHSFLLTDIDECDLGLNNCSEAAACINTIGSFECDCLLGLTGDGVTL